MIVITDKLETGSGRVAILGRAFEQIFGQIVSARENTLGNTNMVATRPLPVEVCRLKTWLLRSPNY